MGLLGKGLLGLLLGGGNKNSMPSYLKNAPASYHQPGVRRHYKRFVEKECLIYTFNGTQINGTVKEVTDGALLLESNGTVEAVNLDFIVRIREYPKKKNGKKKSVVLD